MTVLQLRSPSFRDHTPIPKRHAHDSLNLSPALEWSGVPEGTAELVLLREDPDAPGRTFLHWLVTGIDPSTTGVGEGEVPPGGQEWTNGFGEVGYGGPQPPVGDSAHRYFFRLYALPRRENAPRPSDAQGLPSADDVHHAFDDLALATGVLVGLYQR